MTYIDVFEYIGVAAFAICGAMAGIDRGADIFGVLFVAVITALGGGVIRDMMLGHLPPRMFSSFAYIGVAIFFGLLVFLDAYIRTEKYRKHQAELDSLVNIFDALGLAVFTVTGMDIAIAQCGLENPVLLVLLGMTTGVGGGMVRDVLIDVMPAVLRKRIYAVASMAGGIVYYVLLRLGVAGFLSAIVAMAVIFVLRILATVYKWNLPKVKQQ